MDGERPAGDGAGFDNDGLGPQPPNDRGEQGTATKPWQGAADEMPASGFVFGCPWGLAIGCG